MRLVLWGGLALHVGCRPIEPPGYYERCALPGDTGDPDCAGDLVCMDASLSWGVCVPECAYDEDCPRGTDCMAGGCFREGSLRR